MSHVEARKNEVLYCNKKRLQGSQENSLLRLQGSKKNSLLHPSLQSNLSPTAEDTLYFGSSLTMSSTEGHLFYFAIGSMMNPVSLANRGIRPISSEPAEVLDYRLGFFTAMGVAAAIADKGSSFHGVIHHVTLSDMEKLDKIEGVTEGGYQRETATALLYNGTTRQVTVYAASDELIRNDTINALPQERYLEIMIAGAQHYGVSSEHIEFLQSHDKIPRPSKEEYLSFGPVVCDRTMTLEQVFDNNGLGDKPLFISLNGKVIEVTCDRDSKDFKEYHTMFHLMGQVGELFMSKVLYDPMYGCPECLEDVTPEHAAYCEHALCEILKITGEKRKIVAKLEPPDPKK